MVVCARCVLHDISKNVFKQAFGGYWKMYGDYSLETNRRLPMLEGGYFFPFLLAAFLRSALALRLLLASMRAVWSG